MEKQNTPHRLTQQQMNTNTTQPVVLTMEDIGIVDPLEKEIATLCLKVIHVYELGMKTDSVEDAAYYADIIDTYIGFATQKFPEELNNIYIPELIDIARPLKLLTFEFRNDPKNSPRRHEREADEYAKKHCI